MNGTYATAWTIAKPDHRQEGWADYLSFQVDETFADEYQEEHIPGSSKLCEQQPLY